DGRRVPGSGLRRSRGPGHRLPRIACRGALPGGAGGGRRVPADLRTGPDGVRPLGRVPLTGERGETSPPRGALQSISPSNSPRLGPKRNESHSSTVNRTVAAAGFLLLRTSISSP